MIEHLRVHHLEDSSPTTLVLGGKKCKHWGGEAMVPCTSDFAAHFFTILDENKPQDKIFFRLQTVALPKGCFIGVRHMGSGERNSSTVDSLSTNNWFVEIVAGRAGPGGMRGCRSVSWTGRVHSALHSTWELQKAAEGLFVCSRQFPMLREDDREHIRLRLRFFRNQEEAKKFKLQTNLSGCQHSESSSHHVCPPAVRMKCCAPPHVLLPVCEFVPGWLAAMQFLYIYVSFWLSLYDKAFKRRRHIWEQRLTLDI
jgi:hypothetical protein